MLTPLFWTTVWFIPVCMVLSFAVLGILSTQMTYILSCCWTQPCRGAADRRLVQHRTQFLTSAGTQRQLIPLITFLFLLLLQSRSLLLLRLLSPRNWAHLITCRHHLDSIRSCSSSTSVSVVIGLLANIIRKLLQIAPCWNSLTFAAPDNWAHGCGQCCYSIICSPSHYHWISICSSVVERVRA